MEVFVKIADFNKRRRWYETVARQGDVQAIVILHKDPYMLGYVLEGRYGKLSLYGKIGQHQIERGEILLCDLEEQVRRALNMADWRVVRQAPDGTEIWEHKDQLQEHDNPGEFIKKPEQ